jgi:hypothetical protein
VVRVCCSYYLLHAVSLEKRPFVHFKRYPYVPPGRFIFQTICYFPKLVAVVRITCVHFVFLSLTFSNGTRSAIFRVALPAIVVRVIYVAY